MSNREFGGLVKRSRERLGLSQSRVGDLVGRAPSTIRAWERGQSMPTEPALLSTLAAVLGLDEARLFELADLEPPEITDEHPTIEQSLLEIAPPGMFRPVAREQTYVQETLPVDEVGGDQETPLAEFSGTSGTSEIDEAVSDVDSSAAEEEGPVDESRDAPIVTRFDDDLVADPDLVEPGLVDSDAVDPAQPDLSGGDAADANPTGPESGSGEPGDPLPSFVPPFPVAAVDLNIEESPAAEAPSYPLDSSNGEGLARRRDIRATTNGTAAPVAPTLDRALQQLRTWTLRLQELLPKRSGRSTGPAAPPLSPSYMEIPEQRRVYQLRRIYTAVAVVITLSLVFWAFGQAREALFSTLDLLLEGL